jgi:hypothetical protein
MLTTTKLALWILIFGVFVGIVIYRVIIDSTFTPDPTTDETVINILFCIDYVLSFVVCIGLFYYNNLYTTLWLLVLIVICKIIKFVLLGGAGEKMCVIVAGIGLTLTIYSCLDMWYMYQIPGNISYPVDTIHPNV